MARRHVTSLAEERHLAHEQPLVVRSVRVVAGHATLADRRVLPEIGAPFVGVTARAALVDRRAHLQELDVGAAVRVVARRAGHGAFTHGHVMKAELLVDDRAMTRGAERDLILGLQLRRALGGVDTVAAHTADVALIVLTTGPERVGPGGVAP